MSTGDLSLESLIIRQSVIEKLWEEINLYIVKNEILVNIKEILKEEESIISTYK